MTNHHTALQTGRSTGVWVSELYQSVLRTRFPAIGQSHKVLTHTDALIAQTGTDLTHLHSPEILAPILDRYCQNTYPGNDRRAAISMWSQWYFGMLLTPVMTLISMTGTDFPIGSDRIYLHVNEKGCPVGFDLFDRYLEHPVMPPENTAWHLHTPLITEHLDPLIAALANCSKAAPKLFWANVGVIVAYVEKHILKGQGISLVPLVTDAKMPDGSRNLLRDPYSSKLSSDGSPARRICCLRYMLDAVEMCPTCPLEKL